MIFDWDDNKAASNYRKHHIKFDTASRVFDDVHAVEIFDGIYDGEERSKIIGDVGGTLIVAVIFTERGDQTIRLISARKANEHERQVYYCEK